jgi:hypothetical protein
MIPIVEIRKNPRAVSVAAEGPSAPGSQIASTHIPPFILKILGLGAGKIESTS